MKSRPYDLFTMLLMTVLAEFLKKFQKAKQPVFPAEIGNYYFVKRVKKVGPRKSYQLALYQDGSGKKAFAKMKRANIKGYHYYSLLNEIEMYKILNAVTKKTGDSIPDRFKNIAIPWLITAYEDKNRLVALIEHVEGKTVENLTSQEKLDLYLTAADYFKYLGSELKKRERARISQRSTLNYILFYPLLWVKAALTYPFAVPYLLKGAFIFFRLIPIMIKNNQSSLIHRDLHFKNFIKTRDKYYLIDFQQMVFSEPLHEYITTLRYFWSRHKESNFAQLLLQELVKRNSKRKNFSELFQAYAINSVTHGLTGSGFSQNIILGWIDFFKFCLKPEFKKFENNNRFEHQQKKSVSIGIPAFNEAGNIENLIKSILRQKDLNYSLETIYILNDGSTDETIGKVKKMAEKFPVIRLIDDGKRLGKINRLEEFFGLNTSGIALALDGDIVLGKSEVIAEVVNCFADEKTVLVSANNQPVKSRTLVGKIINYGIYIWYLARIGYNNGDNLHNVRGCCIALTKDFASKVDFPPEVHSYGRYLYLLSQAGNLKFAFAKNAIILYRKPNNLADYIAQTTRTGSDRKKMEMIFGSWIKDKYKMPMKYKVLAVVKAFSQNPFLFLSALVLKYTVKKVHRKKQNSKKAIVWDTVTSTKKPIPVTF